jgi:hypothetical protein
MLFLVGGVACTGPTLPLGTDLICELKEGGQSLQYTVSKSFKLSFSLHESGPGHGFSWWFVGKHGRVQIAPTLEVPGQLFSYPACRQSRFIGESIYVYPFGTSVRMGSGMVVSTDGGRHFVKTLFPGREAPPIVVDGSHVLNQNWSVEATEFVSASAVVLIQSGALCKGCADVLLRRVESRDAGKSWTVTDYAVLEPQAIPASARTIEHPVELRYHDTTKAEVVRENKMGPPSLRRAVDEFWKRAPKTAHEIDRSIPGGGTIKQITDEPWINEAGKVIGVQVKALIHFGDKADMVPGVYAQQQSGSQQLTPLRLYDCKVRQPDGVTLHRELRCRDMRAGVIPGWPAFKRNADYEFTFLLTPSSCFTRQYAEESGGSTLSHPFGPADYGPDIAARYRLRLVFISGFEPVEAKDFTLGQRYRPREFFESIETDPNIKCI